MWAPRSTGRLGGHPRASSHATVGVGCVPLPSAPCPRFAATPNKWGCSNLPSPLLPSPSSSSFLVLGWHQSVHGAQESKRARQRSSGARCVGGGREAPGILPAFDLSQPHQPGQQPALVSLSLSLSLRTLHTTPCGACGASAGRMQMPAATQRPPPTRTGAASIPASAFPPILYHLSSTQRFEQHVLAVREVCTCCLV